jgi:hypothetical protein
MRERARYCVGMVWVIVFVGIALAGLVMLICYAVWLAHKASDVWSEVSMLADRADELAQLVGQIRVPEQTFQPEWPNDRTIYARINDASAT